MIEYAITAGEGILLAHGIAAFAEVDGDGVEVWPIDWKDFDQYPCATLIARPCTPDCETGK